MVQRRFTSVLVILSVLIGTCFILPAAPAAAATCYASGCEGKNPQTTGCSADAITVRSAYLYNTAGTSIVGSVELRWSGACQTFWSRVTSSIGATTIRTRIQRNSPAQTYDDIDYGATQAYNDKMMYAPTSLVRACGRLGTNTIWDCTVYY